MNKEQFRRYVEDTGTAGGLEHLHERIEGLEGGQTPEHAGRIEELEHRLAALEARVQKLEPQPQAEANAPAEGQG